MDVKIAFLNGELKEEVYMYSLKVSLPQTSPRCASYKGPFMDLSKLLKVGIIFR